jgi:hypothetical protein
MGFIQKYIVNMILKKVWGFVLDLVTKYIRETKRAKEQKFAADEYEKVVNNPQSTAEERAKKYAEAINAGRKP